MNSNFSNEKQVKCPQCGRLHLYSTENKSRPFCSERCQLIDLGAWASEEYAIPVQTPIYDEMALEELEEELNKK